MKKYLKPEISVEKLFSSETIADGDPFLDAAGTVTPDGADDSSNDSVYVSTQDWWDKLV